MSATEVGYRIASDKNWKSCSTIKLINEIEGVDRVKNLYNLTKSRVTTEYDH